MNQSIHQIMESQRYLGKSNSTTLQKFAPLLLRGTSLRLVIIGIASMASKSLLAVLKFARLASIVARSSVLLIWYAIILVFVQMRVRARGVEETSSTSKQELARSATNCSASTNTARPSLVPDRVLTVTALPTKSTVYDLTVQGCPEFFAGGVLVHNCDAVRYALEPYMKSNDIKVWSL
jgi:hypothetical protein